MIERRAYKKGERILVWKHSFFASEPLSFIGGFGGYMNGRIMDGEDALKAQGSKGPWGVRFSGGDGKVSPIVLEVFEAQV